MSRPSHQRGAVLVLALWLLLIVGLLLMGLNRVALVSGAQGHGQLQRVQAKWLARAGIEQTLDLLALDITDEDGPLDLWYDDPESFEAFELAEGYRFTVSAPDESYPDGVRYGADDLTGRINVNFASAELLMGLPDIDELTVDAILDWRDGNEEQRPGGAERAYYDRLDYPYEIRNGPLRTHREMMLIRDIDADTFFGDAARPGLERFTTVWSYDSNLAPSGQQKVDLQNTNATELAARFYLTDSLASRIADEDADDPFDLVGLAGDEPAEGYVNEITFQWVADHYEEFAAGGGRGGGGGQANRQRAAKININTAPREVLEALPQFDAHAAERIINTREMTGGFLTIGDLYAADIVTDEAFRQVAAAITIRSNVIRVVSVGVTPGGVRQRIEAVIDRGAEQPTILYWRQSE